MKITEIMPPMEQSLDTHDVISTAPTQLGMVISMRETQHLPLLLIPSAYTCTLLGDSAEMGRRNVVTDTTCTQTASVRHCHMATNLPLPPTAHVATVADNLTLHRATHPSCDGDGEQQGDVGLLVSRLLASNTRPPLPTALRKLGNDPLARHLTFSYTPKVLQELREPDLLGAQVNAVACHPCKPHIIGAACSFPQGGQAGQAGAVALFSLKNTERAERIFRLQVGVVSLEFSAQSPNLLALGLRSGAVWVLDISSPHLKLLHSVAACSRDMVRVVQWWHDNVIYSAGSRVFRINRPFLSSHPVPMMTLVYPDTQGSGFGLSLGPHVSAILRCPSNMEQYVVGGTDGYLRLCSVLSDSQYLQLFHAHRGVVSAVRPVPHSLNMFTTCGSDGSCKLWAYNLPTPLLLLTAAVQPNSKAPTAHDSKAPTAHDNKAAAAENNQAATAENNEATEDNQAAAVKDNPATTGEDNEAAPGEDNTAAPGEDNEAAPGEDNTAAPGEDNTAAPDGSGLGVVELVDVSWSPLHATVAVAACPSHLYVWDIRRRTHLPVVSAAMPHGLLNVQFSEDGQYLLAGSSGGSLLLIGLHEMPFPEALKGAAWSAAVVAQLRLSGQTHLINSVTSQP